MPKITIPGNSTSVRVTLSILDTSQQDTRGLTGLTYNAAGLTAAYWRADDGNAGATVVTLASATRGSYTSGGFVEKDATNFPGDYEFGVPNAALAPGSSWVRVNLFGAANMAPVRLEIQLEASAALTDDDAPPLLMRQAQPQRPPFVAME